MWLLHPVPTSSDCTVPWLNSRESPGVAVVLSFVEVATVILAAVILNSLKGVGFARKTGKTKGLFTLHRWSRSVSGFDPDSVVLIWIWIRILIQIRIHISMWIQSRSVQCLFTQSEFVSGYWSDQRCHVNRANLFPKDLETTAIAIHASAAVACFAACTSWLQNKL